MKNANKYILILGASIESHNRGVNALGVGAISLLSKSYPSYDFKILQFSRQTRESLTEIVINGKPIKVKSCYFNSYDLMRCICVLLVRKLFIFCAFSNMSELVLRAERIFNVNEGDSFSDIYGYRRLFRHFVDSYVVLLAGKRLTFLPQTIGPFHTQLGLFLAKFLLKRIDKVYLRDCKGEGIVTSIGIPCEITVDMACFMKEKHVDILLPQKFVAININGLLYFEAYGEMTHKYKLYKTMVTRMIELIVEQGYEVLLVPHTYDYNCSSIVEDDLEAIKHLIKKFNSDRINFLDLDLDAQELKYVISQAEFFIGSRMHACIAALSTSVPTVGLSYSYKFEGTFDMFGQKDCAIDIVGINDSNLERVFGVIDEIFARRHYIRRELETLNRQRNEINII